MTKQELEEMKTAYEEGMMHLMRVRTYAERANAELIRLGELLEQQGAKNERTQED